MNSKWEATESDEALKMPVSDNHKVDYGPGKMNSSSDEPVLLEREDEMGIQSQQVSLLLVDDRPENVLALEAILSDLGHNLVHAYSGPEVLRAVLEHEFAVILLDVRMPGMDGFEIATLLRQREQTQHTPIIFLTAGDKSTTLEFKGYSVGAVDYLSKPLDSAILKAKVGVFIELYQKSRQLRLLNDQLEQRVARRTEELENANQELTREILERRRIEAEVRSLNSDLENRVRDRTTELEAANEELRSFSYSVSHDLRAPVRRVESFSQMLVEEHAGELSESAQEYISRIRASCQQMSQLIDDMLKLSQITGTEVRRERIDLSKMVSEIASDLQQNEPERKVDFHIQDSVTAQADRNLIRLALHNLVENAWKFTTKREDPVVEFGTEATNGSVAYFVRDNGVGFDPSQRDMLFAPFQRLHKKTDFPGTGIGLAIVQRVIQRHGGSVDAQALPGEGATFYFTL